MSRNAAQCLILKLLLVQESRARTRTRTTQQLNKTRRCELYKSQSNLPKPDPHSKHTQQDVKLVTFTLGTHAHTPISRWEIVNRL